MSTLEDKILGEKKEYYCSSSEDEDDSHDDSEIEENANADLQNISCSEMNNIDTWNGTCSNTGPKGVLHDWKKFKQLESEKKAQNDEQYLKLLKKFSMSCKSSLDEEKEKNNDEELDEFLEDEFLVEYQRQRMKEMLSKVQKFKFGTVINLNNADEFLKAIDDEDKSVTVVVHIYEPKIPGCDAMNGCLITLAEEYPHVKFCKILGSVVGLSKHFKKEGVPAILVYKNGQVIGNYVHVTDTLGTDFYVSDVENFLLENGIIIDKNNIPKIISNNIE
ncbi:phosducin-like protein [Chelonus insularis]|uniref:phosducin-like protein n=1 Tax=Chelonus insularis TaxID=460826 RepID=UPI001589E24B|nr:phosducin-like protein [Chelonus insularis]